jgi:hypothetical protein
VQFRLLFIIKQFAKQHAYAASNRTRHRSLGKFALRTSHAQADVPCSCTDLLKAPDLSAEASQRIILMLSGEFCAIESFTCTAVSHAPGSSVARPKEQSVSPARLLNGLSVPTFVSGNGLSAAAGYSRTEKHDILEPIQLPQPQGIFLRWLHVSLPTAPCDIDVIGFLFK